MKNKKYNVIILFVLGLIFSSCGSSKLVEPLRKNENAIAVELGGPLIKIPGSITAPLPFTSIMYGRGITNDLTLHGSWYSTASVFGIAQIDLGATYGFWKSKDEKHGFSGMLGFNTALDVYETKSFKFWPQLNAHYYLKYNFKQQTQDELLTNGSKRANLFYVGFSTWYELGRIKAHGEKQKNIVIPSFDIGHDLNWKRWTFKLELRLIAPFTSNKDIVVEYKSITGKTGATGVYLGFMYRFKR
ncbi:MAG: hypothetical protein M9897_10015 [Brumimicrobium sp.]|nr:hypothetical protein [Brumimicrobium sp.]